MIIIRRSVFIIFLVLWAWNEFNSRNGILVASAGPFREEKYNWYSFHCTYFYTKGVFTFSYRYEKGAREREREYMAHGGDAFDPIAYFSRESCVTIEEFERGPFFDQVIRRELISSQTLWQWIGFS